MKKITTLIFLFATFFLTKNVAVAVTPDNFKNKLVKDLATKVNELENLTKTSYAFYLKNSNLKDRL